jgi:hypothetical protein
MNRPCKFKVGDIVKQIYNVHEFENPLVEVMGIITRPVYYSIKHRHLGNNKINYSEEEDFILVEAVENKKQIKEYGISKFIDSLNKRIK